MKRITVAAALTLLAGCSGQDAPVDASVAVEIAPEAAPPASNSVDARPVVPTSPASGPSSVAAPNRPLLAYRHQVALELPGHDVPRLVQRHEAACTAAGQEVCQVLAVSSQRFGRDSVSASLELRARPDWLQRFRAGLERDARAAGGRMTSTSTTAEDLTRTIVDAEARLRAQQTMRDRLQAMLEQRPGALSDVLAVEKELARVQAELDASRSGLAVLRTQVVTSTLTLEYATEAAALEDGVLAPVRSAAVDFLRHLAAAAGALITAAAYALPWLLALALMVWAGRRWGLWRRLRPPAHVRRVRPRRRR